MKKKLLKSFFFNYLLGKAAYGPYILACSCICYIIFHYYNIEIIEGFLNEPIRMFMQATGIEGMSNAESIYLGKIFSYTIGYILLLPFSFLIYSTCFIYLLSFIPCFIGKVYFNSDEDTSEFLFSEIYEITVPFPFIAPFFVCICKYLSETVLFLCLIGFHTLCLFSAFCFIQMGMDTMNAIDYLGFTFFTIISLGIYIYLTIKNVVLLFVFLSVQFLVFLLPVAVLTWKIFLIPVLTILPACIVFIIILNYYRIPCIWKILSNKKRKTGRFITAYSIYVIVLCVPIIYSIYNIFTKYQYCLSSLFTQYESFVINKATACIPSCFYMDLDTLLYTLILYIKISKVFFTIIIVLSIIFLFVYTIFISKQIIEVGKSKEFVSKKTWDFLYLRSFSDEDSNFEKLLQRNGVTLTIDNPNDNRDFLMKGIYLDDNWKKYVMKYSDICKHIFIKIGKTDGVRWEMQNLFNRNNVHYYVNKKEDMKRFVNSIKNNDMPFNDEYLELLNDLTNIKFNKIIFTLINGKIYYCKNERIDQYVENIDNIEFNYKIDVILKSLIRSHKL